MRLDSSVYAWNELKPVQVFDMSALFGERIRKELFLTKLWYLITLIAIAILPPVVIHKPIGNVTPVTSL